MGVRTGFTGVALQFLHNLLRLQVPDVNHVVLGARHNPLQETGLASPPRTPPHPTVTTATVLTFPPVTEKLANRQYFSFLWPVYVFKHCHIQRGMISCTISSTSLRNSALYNEILCLPCLCCSPTASACCKFSRNVFTSIGKTGKI